MPFVYSDRYFADIGYHVFPIIKYREVYRKLLAEGGFNPSDFLEPNPAPPSQLLTVHTPEFLDDLKNCAWTPRTLESELPISPEIVELFVLAAGGTILACQEATRHGWCVHLSGGFHHAFADKAEGFCYINDLAVATRVVQQEGRVDKVAIIDCDLHQGNGTAHIFQNDDAVFTFSIHQRDLYPVKQKSDLDIHLPIGVTDEKYLGFLNESVPKLLDEFAPDLVVYQAGADPYKHDQLGRLALSIDGLRQRDSFIYSQCRARQIPFAVTLGGGYAVNTADTVRIHFNTCQEAAQSAAS